MKNKVILPLLGLTCLMTLMGTTSCVGPIKNPNEDLASAKFKASEVLGKIKSGYNIGNTLDANPGFETWNNDKKSFGNITETSWGNPAITSKYIKAIKDHGFDSVRLPVTWYPHCDMYWRIDTNWLDRVEQVINMCIDNDLLVLVDIHHDTGVNGWFKGDNSDASKAAKQEKYFTKIWSQIATRFNDIPNDKLIFEGFNEPINYAADWQGKNKDHIEYVNHLGQLFVDTIRDTGGNNAERILVCSTYAASINPNMVKGFKLPKDRVNDALAMEIHAYTPWEFTNGDKTSYKFSDIDGPLKLMHDKVKGTNVPAIMGEFGLNFVHSKVDNEKQVKYFKDYMSCIKKYDIVPYYWDDGGDFKLIDRKSGEVTRPDVLNELINYYK